MVTKDIDLLPLSVQEYLRIYLSSTRSRSENTVLSYGSDLRLFFRYIYSIKEKIDIKSLDKHFDLSPVMDIQYISKINSMDVFRFLEFCKKEYNASSTSIARKISCLRGYFQYVCVKMRYLSDNPMNPIDTPKTKKTLPKYLTLNQCIQLLNSVDGNFKERDYCILTVLLNCGLRVAELVGLNISDINFDENTMLVTGKGNKQRILYLTKSCREAIIGYLSVRKHDGVKDKDALFISHVNTRMSRRSVQYLVEKYIKKIGLEGQGYSVHKLRHTAATLMYRQGGVDVLVLKEVLGHENLSTTQIYTHIATEQIKEAACSNPLSGEK